MKQEPPFDLPGRSSDTLECTVEPIQPGHFEAQLHVYLDDEGLREIVMKVRGEAGTKSKNAWSDALNNLHVLATP